MDCTPLTKYEKVRVLSTRATQLSMGAPANVDIKNLTNAMDIAEKELQERVLPIKIIRKFPNGSIMEVSVNKLKIL